MKGRLEHAIANENIAESIAKTLPPEVLEWYYSIAVSMEPRSCKAYIELMRVFVRFLGNPESLKTVSDVDVQRYMKSIETKEVNGELVSTSFSYRQLTYSVLNKFFDFCQRKKWIEENPMSFIRRARQKDTVSRYYLTENDLRKIISVIGNKTKSQIRDMAIIRLFIATGIRETALCEINIEDINFSKKTLTVIDKGNKTHVHVLGDNTIEALNNWLTIRNDFLGTSDSPALFISNRGNRVIARNVQQMVKKYTKKALGKELSPHKLRAAYGTILYNKTKDIRFVQDRMGHASVTTTQLYVVQDNTAAEKAAKLMDF